jgi:hypothetical protein
MNYVDTPASSRWNINSQIHTIRPLQKPPTQSFQRLPIEGRSAMVRHREPTTQLLNLFKDNLD